MFAEENHALQISSLGGSARALSGPNDALDNQLATLHTDATAAMTQHRDLLRATDVHKSFSHRTGERGTDSGQKIAKKHSCSVNI